MMAIDLVIGNKYKIIYEDQHMIFAGFGENGCAIFKPTDSKCDEAHFACVADKVDYFVEYPVFGVVPVGGSVIS